MTERPRCNECDRVYCQKCNYCPNNCLVGDCCDCEIIDLNNRINDTLKESCKRYNFSYNAELLNILDVEELKANFDAEIEHVKKFQRKLNEAVSLLERYFLSQPLNKNNKVSNARMDLLLREIDSLKNKGSEIL